MWCSQHVEHRMWVSVECSLFCVSVKSKERTLQKIKAVRRSSSSWLSHTQLHVCMRKEFCWRSRICPSHSKTQHTCTAAAHSYSSLNFSWLDHLLTQWHQALGAFCAVTIFHLTKKNSCVCVCVCRFKNVIFDIVPGEQDGCFLVKARFMGVDMERFPLKYQVSSDTTQSNKHTLFNTTQYCKMCLCVLGSAAVTVRGRRCDEDVW